MDINKNNIKESLKKVFGNITTITKWCLDHLSFLLLVATVVLAMLLARQCERAKLYKDEKARLENNIAAMNDTLMNYKKNGYNYAQMLALQLKLNELADSLQLGNGNTPVTIMQYITSIKDTVYLAGEVVHDTVYSPMFASDKGIIMGERSDRFGKSSRNMSVFTPYYVSAADGKVYAYDSIEVILSQNIWLESTLYKGKDKKTYMQVRSDYPSTAFNSGNGILVDNGPEYELQARKRFGVGIGLQAGYGIGFNMGKPVLTPYIGVGIGLQYTPRRFQF